VLDLDLSEKSAKQQVKQMVGQWIKNEALRVEKRQDKARCEKRFVVVGRWASDAQP
jgi:hypothetical protein